MALVDMSSEITDLVPALGRVRARKLVNRAWKIVQDSCLWSKFKWDSKPEFNLIPTIRDVSGHLQHQVRFTDFGAPRRSQLARSRCPSQFSMCALTTRVDENARIGPLESVHVAVESFDGAGMVESSEVAPNVIRPSLPLWVNLAPMESAIGTLHLSPSSSRSTEVVDLMPKSAEFNNCLRLKRATPTARHVDFHSSSKLKMSKLSLEFLRSSAIGGVRKFCGRESTEPNLLSVVEYLRSPRVSGLTPVSTLKAGFIVALVTGICLLLVTGGTPQIVTAIVESVVVLMVALNSVAIFQAQDLSVHPNLFPRFPFYSRKLADGVVALGVVIPVCLPHPSRKGVEIGDINLSDLSPRKGNDAVGLIQRLNNRLADDATFGHDSTSNGIAVFDRFFIISGGSLWLS